MDVDGHRQSVGLFRYSLIRPLADPELGAGQRGALVRALVSVDHVGPDGRRVEVSAPTLRRWLRAWRTEGFAGLVPVVRAQPTRTAAEIASHRRSSWPRRLHRDNDSRPRQFCVGAVVGGPALDLEPSGRLDLPGIGPLLST
jgi:Helix-turn-helix domain